MYIFLFFPLYNNRQKRTRYFLYNPLVLFHFSPIIHIVQLFIFILSYYRRICQHKKRAKNYADFWRKKDFCKLQIRYWHPPFSMVKYYGILGCSQVVRHQTLTLAFAGSSPAIPAKKRNWRLVRQLRFFDLHSGEEPLQCDSIGIGVAFR